MNAQAFYNPSASHPVKDGELNVLMRSALLENLPAPVNTAANALHLIAKRGGLPEGAPPSGGFHLPA